MFCYPNLIEGATLSTGSYEATLPLNNLKLRPLYMVARAVDDAVASTKFDADLGSGYAIRVLALLKHNISLAGLIRMRVSTVSNFATTTYDTGWVTAYPQIYPLEVMSFGDPGFWDGKLSEEMRLAGYRQDFIVILPAATLGRYVRVEVDDTANPDGYVEFGGFFTAPGDVRTVNMAVGATLGWTTGTVATDMPGGSRHFLVRPQRRALTFSYPAMSPDEALVKPFDFIRIYGTDARFYFVYDLDDTYHLSRRSFPATLRELSPLTTPYALWNEQAFALTEDW